MKGINQFHVVPIPPTECMVMWEQDHVPCRETAVAIGFYAPQEVEGPEPEDFDRRPQEVDAHRAYYTESLHETWDQYVLVLPKLYDSGGWLRMRYVSFGGSCVVCTSAEGVELVDGEMLCASCSKWRTGWFFVAGEYKHTPRSMNTAPLVSFVMNRVRQEPHLRDALFRLIGEDKERQNRLFELLATPPIPLDPKYSELHARMAMVARADNLKDFLSSPGTMQVGLAHWRRHTAPDVDPAFGGYVMLDRPDVVEAVRYAESLEEPPTTTITLTR